jgi:Domain of unknown function (DUF1840)
MIYEFKCRATGSVVMTQAVAERLLEIISISPGPKGIITVSNMPMAIQALEKAVALDKEQSKARGNSDQPEDKDKNTPEAVQPVSLAQRAFPFVEMIRAAFAAQKDITWGV